MASDAVSESRNVFVTVDVDTAVSAALTAQGLQTLSFNPETLADLLAQPKDAGAPPCVVLWSDPGQTLAKAIREGAPVAPELDSWAARAKALLTLFQRNRRGLLLVDARILTAPDAGREQDMLRDRLQYPDLRLPLDIAAEVDQAAVGQMAVDQTGGALMTAMCLILMTQIDGIRELREELQAASITPLDEGVRAELLYAANAEFGKLLASQEAAEHLRCQVDQQMQALAKAEDTNQRQGSELAQATEALSLLRRQVGLQTQALVKAEDTSQRQGSELAEATEALSLLRIEADQQAQALKKARKTSKRQGSDLAQATEALSQLRTEADQQAQELKKARKTIERQSADLAQATEKLSLLRAEADQQAQALTQAQDTIQRQGSDLAQAAEALSLLRTEADQQTQALKKARKTIERQSADLAQATEKLSLLRTEADQQAQALTQAQDTIQRQGSDLTQATEALSLLRTEADQQAQAQKKARKTIERQSADLARATEKLNLLRAEADQQAQALTQAQDTIQRQGSDLAQAKEAAMRAEASRQDQDRAHQIAMQEADRVLAEALDNLQNEKKKCEGLQSQCDLLMQRSGELSARLDALFASTSWRITQPIRSVKRLVARDGKPIDKLMAEEARENAPR